MSQFSYVIIVWLVYTEWTYHLYNHQMLLLLLIVLHHLLVLCHLVPLHLLSFFDLMFAHVYNGSIKELINGINWYMYIYVVSVMEMWWNMVIETCVYCLQLWQQGLMCTVIVILLILILYHNYFINSICNRWFQWSLELYECCFLKVEWSYYLRNDTRINFPKFHSNSLYHKLIIFCELLLL